MNRPDVDDIIFKGPHGKGPHGKGPALIPKHPKDHYNPEILLFKPNHRLNENNLFKGPYQKDTFTFDKLDFGNHNKLDFGNHNKLDFDNFKLGIGNYNKLDFSNYNKLNFGEHHNLDLAHNTPISIGDHLRTSYF